MSFDVILVGGGLQNSLIAAALRHLRPHWKILLVEKNPRLGADQTWSFPLADLPAAARPFVDPLITYQWPRYEVRFPEFTRTLEQPYATIVPESLHQGLAPLFAAGPLHRESGCELWTDRPVAEVGANHIRLPDGRKIDAAVVLDGRGTTGPHGSVDSRGNIGPGGSVDEKSANPDPTGYQKFFGLEIQTDAGALAPSFAHPILMDATISQRDGYRFVYVLPFTADRALVEETYFSNTPDLDLPPLRQSVSQYLDSQGISRYQVLREEVGVLRMPWGRRWVDGAERTRMVGTRGEWFHPATGYSFPIAVRLALAVASAESPPMIPKSLEKLADRLESNDRYARFLNRMFFTACKSADRRGFLERFYRLPEQMIRRFYSLELTWVDRLWILVHRFPRGLQWSKVFVPSFAGSRPGQAAPPDSVSPEIPGTEPAMLVPSDARCPTLDDAQERE